MKFVRILNKTHPARKPVQARYCSSFFCRLRGLMFRPSLPEHEGLFMVQTRADRLDASIHMLFMAFDITVVWLDPLYRVVDVRLAKRWRPAYFPTKPAQYILEIHPRRLDEFHIGDQLVIEPC